ncbi:MAG TPA: universal stress protein [Polyangiaceae bacterium]|nr:universal stress protein [Polyangiaceae bacterium]
MSKSERPRKPREPQHVVVGLDYSEDSERALYASFETIRGNLATLHVLAVAEGDGPPLPPELTEDTKRRFLEEAHATLDRYVGERLETLGSDTIDRARLRTAVDFGDAAERILALADAVDADLIVVGPRGKTGMDRLLVGSVADQVLRHAPCSVLIARVRHTGARGRSMH